MYTCPAAMPSRPITTPITPSGRMRCGPIRSTSGPPTSERTIVVRRSRWQPSPLNVLSFTIALAADGVFAATLSLLLAGTIPVSSALLGAGLLLALLRQHHVDERVTHRGEPDDCRRASDRFPVTSGESRGRNAPLRPRGRASRQGVVVSLEAWRSSMSG